MKIPRERKTKDTQATDPTEVSRVLESDLRIAATVTADRNTRGERNWNWLVRVLFSLHAGQPSRRGWAIVSTGTAHGSHRSRSLHVHWPIPTGSLTTAWSGRVIRTGGSSSAGRLRGRLQRSYDTERSQRTRQSRIVLPTSRPAETPREFFFNYYYFVLIRNFIDIRFRPTR